MHHVCLVLHGSRALYPYLSAVANIRCDTSAVVEAPPNDLVYALAAVLLPHVKHTTRCAGDKVYIYPLGFFTIKQPQEKDDFPSKLCMTSRGPKRGAKVCKPQALIFGGRHTRNDRSRKGDQTPTIRRALRSRQGENFLPSSLGRRSLIIFRRKRAHGIASHRALQVSCRSRGHLRDYVVRLEGFRMYTTPKLVSSASRL